MNTINNVLIARGEKKAELVLKNCNVIDVFNGVIRYTDIAINDGIIVGIGTYNGFKEVDINGKFVSPGFIDGHVHIESSMLSPALFGKLIIPKGTTTVIADPHEIANVCGIDGIRYMIKSSKKSPLEVYYMLPSCVPSTNVETSGSILLADDLKELFNEDYILGLGEMMNYPGVIYGDKNVHDKLSIKGIDIRDGHAPKLSGKKLNAYISVGIKTDHECSTADELLEKVSKGMYIHIREGSASRNLSALINGISNYNSRRIMFCTDDKHPGDIEAEGHINYNIKQAIKAGIDPITAIQMATLNIAECYNLKNIGAIAPGYQADLVILDDLENINIRSVYKKGTLVAKDNEALFDTELIKDTNVLNTINIKEVDRIRLDITLNSNKVKVIELIDDSIITKQVIKDVVVIDNVFHYKDEDILKLAVIERHKATGNIGLGLVSGYGLKNGAVGTTIAHDSHNIIVIGDNDEDILLAIKELKNSNGGITICSNGNVLKTLPLEIAGLMTDSPVKEVEQKLHDMELLCRKMGVPETVDPFLTLAFLSLPVIPELKLTDKGLFNFELFSFVSIEK